MASQEAIDELVIAAHGNIAKVREMIAADPSLANSRSSLDESPLGAAAHVGNRVMAEYLLGREALLEGWRRVTPPRLMRNACSQRLNTPS